MDSKFNLTIAELENLSKDIRKDVFNIAKIASSGHVGGNSSSVELMTSLYFSDILHFNPQDPRDENRDRVLVRGHLGPLRYKIFSLLGWVQDSELKTYRSLGSRLQGHEDMFLLPGVDLTPSGSLGMLLSYGVGSSLVARNTNKSFKTIVFLGDGEEQEGNVSEAARHAGSLGLDNLVVILDKNQKQLSHPTNYSDGNSNLQQIWEGYGFDVKLIDDGHNIEEIISTYKSLENQTKPTLIIANTIKGKDIQGAKEHYSGYHTISTAKNEFIDDAIKNIENSIDGDLLSETKTKLKQSDFSVSRFTHKNYDFNISCNNFQSTNLLAALVNYLQEMTSKVSKENINFYSITPDLIREDILPVLGLDKSNVFHYDVGIREQHATALIHGISWTDPNSIIFLDLGEEFLYRNADQISVISQSKTPVTILGNMGGICGAKNGATHQPSSQIGMLSLMPGMKVLEPYDEQDLFACLNYSFSNKEGPTYIRMHSGPIKSFSKIVSDRNIGFYVAEKTPDDSIAIVSNGLTLKGSLEARNLLLERDNIKSRVFNIVNRDSLNDKFQDELFGIKKIFTIYNGVPRILSDAVASSLIGKKEYEIYEHGFFKGTSGSLEDLTKHFGFDGDGIYNFIKGTF